MYRIPSLFGLSALLVPGMLAAQTCLGRPGLQCGDGNFGVGATSFDEGRSFCADLVIGGPVFGFGQARYITFDAASESVVGFGGGLGYEVSPGGGTIGICPALMANDMFGFECLGTKFTALESMPQISAGFEVEVSSAVSLLPYAQAGLVVSRVTATNQLGKETESDTSGALVLGGNLFINRTVSLGPRVSIPIGLEDAKVSFGLVASVTMGT
jgi:hypothetical protein